MVEDLLNRLRIFESELENKRNKTQAYMSEMIGITSKPDMDFCSGQISAYDDAENLLLQYFPELKEEQK